MLETMKNRPEDAAQLPRHPTYAAAFQCIGAACEDHCCGDFDIPLDRRTYERYQGLRSERLVQIVQRSVSVQSPHGPDGLYGVIHGEPSGLCPFFDADRLCAIQSEAGADALSATCSIYPRSLSYVAGRLEGSLSLSCPEAARKVLFDAGFLRAQGDLFAGLFRTDNTFYLACDERGYVRKPAADYLAIRSTILALVQDRTQPLRHRLLLVGALCKRLDEVIKAGRKREIPRVLREFAKALQQKPEWTALIGILPQPAMRLRVFRAMAEARMDEGVGERFRTVLDAFFALDEENFVPSEQAYLQPWIALHPQALENCLISSIFLNLFPYGRDGSADFAPLNLFDEWVLLATQFAFVQALLVGMAARQQETFAPEHVVFTVQSHARTVEHYPAVLRSVLVAMKAHKLDSLQGVASLLG
jgi:lysine-N-methylase